ncbi:RICIN domain-containing protein [Undibacterium sp. Ji42W]|uniref:RICIN domain-containing protein n=1 Tax=Undibacterium sp. Ji42W TaxID=3413039 RepID=UPI003BF199F3
MAFNFENDRPYFIIPKHSKQPLGVQRQEKQRGLKIESQNAIQGSAAQQVRFARHGKGHFYVIMSHSGLYWDIKNASQDAGAELLQWDWGDSHGNSPNQRFRLMSNGEGYYYIKAAHSGLTLEVKDAGKDGAQVQQNQLNTNTANRDYQLFSIMPASTGYLVREPMAFKVHTDFIREATLSLIDKMPELGGAVQAIVGFFWPDNHDQNFWDQITAYVEQRMKDLLKQAEIKTLTQTLEGIKKNLKEYLTTTNLTNKRIKLIAAIAAATQVEHQYLDNDGGLAVLPLMASWGTMVLTMRMEMVSHYNKANLLLASTDEVALKADGDELQFLNEAIARFGLAASTSRKKAMEWRLSFIVSDVKVTSSGQGRLEEYWVEDRYEGWRVSHTSAPSSRVHDPYAKAKVDKAKEMHVARVKAKFDVELDVILAQVYLWPYFNREQKPGPGKKKVAVTTAYGYMPSTNSFAAKLDDLGEVVLWTHANNQPHAFLCGLQLLPVKGDGFSAGKTEGNKQTLKLATGEYICNVRLLEWDNIILGLILETNLGRSIQAGKIGDHINGRYFDAGLDDMVAAKLVNISGTHSADKFNSLNFHWEYERAE